ncbi:hypothetical protein M378DRAFT_174426 [Amanita muscaria Koide BX008]|uniref:Uncharacterized protein n=1 Tax=Amanita muscaria (strain Koide BX008) TaxID=946122 RepID=A0A0C2WC33_AMAMK|nr:hypothetical protein M378DRAFT_174426 [Amanita muscaria Koide BX008]
MPPTTVIGSLQAMPRKVADDAAAFNEFVEKMTFYNDIVHTNQPFLQRNLARAQEIHDELSASSLSSANTPLPRTKQDQKENLKNIEAFCIKEPPKGLDDCIRLVFVGMGALALLMQQEGLSAVRKSEAIKLVGERMLAKYFAPEIQRMRDSPLHFPFSPFSRETVRVDNTAPDRDTEAYQCTPEEAVDLVQRNPSSVVERLYGVGVEEDQNLKWRFMGASIGRGQKTFDLEYGTDASRDVDEDTFITLIMRTKGVYIPLD